MSSKNDFRPFQNFVPLTGTDPNDEIYLIKAAPDMMVFIRCTEHDGGRTVAGELLSHRRPESEQERQQLIGRAKETFDSNALNYLLDDDMWTIYNEDEGCKQ